MWHWCPPQWHFHNQPQRQDGGSSGGRGGGAVAADSISIWPKGAAQTESSLLPNSLRMAFTEQLWR